MKKLFTLVVVMMVFATAGYSQHFGIKGGLNFANLKGNVDSLSLNSRTGYHIGVFADFGFGDHFSIHPEIIYSKQGGKTSVSGGGLSFDYKQKLTYINVPILAQMKYGPVYVNAGPQFGFLSAAEAKASFSGTGGLLGGSSDNKDSFKGTDISGVIGAGLQFSKLDVGLRYNLGLSDIVKDNQGDAVKNSVLMVSVGIQLF